ncbi:MAG TPA: metallophosphoesterase [Candidatus Sulfotelmatobacter sp.]|nr:metallophosphoesterase [Candidatus Sulfotelmatobacter sp.]
MRTRIAAFIFVFQSLLLAAHWFIYATWIRFGGALDPPGPRMLRIAVGVLAVSFVAASLLAFRNYSAPARIFYTVSAVWLGCATYFLLAACLCWIAAGCASVFGAHIDRPSIAGVLFGAGILTTLYGAANAGRTRVKKIPVRLQNLPEAWRGRTAALVSDLHLGHVRGVGFAKKIVRMLATLRPDVVFLTGDVYDGTAADLNALVAPLKELAAPFGAYFITGNHESFRDPAGYLDALRSAGIRILDSEKVELDGLQVVGVSYRDSVNPGRFAAVLRQAAIDGARASILLVHSPHQLPIAADAGISFQLSGHTHRGQFFPFTWMVSRIFGPYAYGLHAFGEMQAYTTSGAGTWGPPLRVGSNPEIVLIQFE